MAAVFGVCVANAAWSQDAAPAKPQMMAKEADPGWDVVTVKPGDPNDTSAGFRVHGREVEIAQKTVESMLLYGYGIQRSQVVNAPDWIRTELWHVQGIADLPGQPSHMQIQSMVRKLLAERFGLLLHMEQREMPVYAMTVTKGGPKLEPSKDDAAGPQNESDSENAGQVTMRARNFPIGQLASVLMRNFLDRPVVDQTGLTKRYDLELKWTQDETRAPTDGSAAPVLFTAMREQLGLKLEPVKAPADVLVIDKVERPGAN